MDSLTSSRALDASLEAKIRNLESLAAIRLKVTSILHYEADDDDDETARAPKLGVASSTSQPQNLRSRRAERAAGVRLLTLRPRLSSACRSSSMMCTDTRLHSLRFS